MPDKRKPFSPKRLLAVLAFFAFWCVAIGGRLIQFQVIQHQAISDYADKMYSEAEPILVRRGAIYDSRMTELATSLTINTILADPEQIRDIHATVETLAPLLEMESGLLLSRLTDPAYKKPIVLKRKVDPGTASDLQALGINGISIEAESLRTYPYRNLASHTLGFVNRAGKGVAGLEQKYDRQLRGVPGRIVREVDALGRPYREKKIIHPIPGHSLVLSMDGYIQYITQTELEAGVKRARASAGVAIVMEPPTGRILALANYPDFDCSRYGEYNQELWKNRAVQDQFEPGSTLKVVTASAALDAGLVRPDEVIDCQMGSMMVGGHRFLDHKPFGLMTFQEILEQSSNIGAIKLGMRLGEERLYQALSSFGFGSKTGIDLPAEATGLLRDRKKWSALSIASISFGHEIAVNCLQILTAVNAVANGGYLVTPSVVDRIVNHRGETVHIRDSERKRIMRPATAAEMRTAIEGVVLRGTGQRAALRGYRAAGKSGTAQKAEGGRFSKTKYVASFIGFAPLPLPRATILVQIDEPKGAIYGGEVSAPIFSRIAQRILIKMQVPQDWNLLSDRAGLPPIEASAMAESAF